MKSWKVSSQRNRKLSIARLTEFLRDFKSVQEEEDIYGDGQMDVDNIPAKYMQIMVLYSRESESLTQYSKRLRIGRRILLPLSWTM